MMFLGSFCGFLGSMQFEGRFSRRKRRFFANFFPVGVRGGLVVSGQWSVVSGQWAVGSGQNDYVEAQMRKAMAFSPLTTGHWPQATSLHSLVYPIPWPFFNKKMKLYSPDSPIYVAENPPGAWQPGRNRRSPVSRGEPDVENILDSRVFGVLFFDMAILNFVSERPVAWQISVCGF
jgi:hypothetical protein